MFFLAESHEDKAFFNKLMASAGPNEIWALHKNAATIRAAITDVLALEAVQRSGQELAADPIASREVRERLQAARSTEREVFNGLISNPTLSDWYWRSKPLSIADRRMLQHAFSEVMDGVYAGAPIIRNELINRDRLSSQAAAARNKLFQHMLAKHAKPRSRHSEIPARASHLSLGARGWRFTRRN